MNKKILISLCVIGAVAAIVVGGTIAFFSDTETSTGNTFTAGAIDLTVDNESYVTGPTGALVASPNTSWILSDITGQLFFNFSDLKPGDIGEDTISLHVDSNDAYLCAAARITDNSDQTCTEPELSDDTTCTNPGLNQGDLGSALHFAFWADDGDNVYEFGETIFLQGSIENLGQLGKIALADSAHNVWNQSQIGGVLPSNTTKYIGKAWCFGTLTPAAVAVVGDGNPITRGTGFTCDGVTVNNAAQSDRVMGDIQFYAVQARNNSGFTCANGYNPVYPGTRTLILDNKNPQGWQRITDVVLGTLTYKTADDDFEFTLNYTGLTVGTSYSLIYYADQQNRFVNWGGDTIGEVIYAFIPTNSDGTTGLQNVNLGKDLPDPADWNGSGAANYCATPDNYNTCRGAKIWLVPTSNLTGGTSLPLNAWNPSTYLFETDLINYNDTNN